VLRNRPQLQAIAPIRGGRTVRLRFWIIVTGQGVITALLFLIIANTVVIVIGHTSSTANTERVILVASAIAVPDWNVRASTIINGSGAVADATSIQGSDAVVHIIANAIAVCICGAITPTFANGVGLVALTITITCGDVVASTLINFTRTVANSAGVENSNTIVDVITDAVSI